jgi:hypothetical protein
MRLLLAHDHDIAARKLASLWGDDAILLTPAELHAERMLLRVDPQGNARAEIRSRPEVTSVLTRLAGIGPTDLWHVDPQDLHYAASELEAFLRAWLGAWTGPVVNRPSTTCLNGPGWRPEQWAVAATQVKFDVSPVRRRVALHAAPDPVPSPTLTQVTVVGDRWFGPVRDGVGRRLCSLAVAAGCTVLEAALDEDTLAHLSAWPDVAAPDVADALAVLLDGLQ